MNNTPAQRVAHNVEAARTVTSVTCPYCGSAAGYACITDSGRPATFAHATRLAARRTMLAIEAPVDDIHMLSMMAVARIRDDFFAARRRVARWQPRPCPAVA